MPLTNKQLREKKMRNFLMAMQVNASQVEIHDHEGVFLFTSQDNQQLGKFTRRLNEVLGVPSDIETAVNLAQVIDTEISQATCSDLALADIHRMACKNIFAIIKAHSLRFVYNPETQQAVVQLPSSAYVPLLSTLTYPNLTFTPQGQLIIHLRHYLQSMSGRAVYLQGLNPSQPPFAILPTQSLLDQGIFYQTQTLTSGEVRVTPYFLVPPQATPPDYHFVLDLSGSMNKQVTENYTALMLLQKSVHELANQLYKFQPQANIILTTFNTNMRNLGSFTSNRSSRLHRLIDGLMAGGDTNLYSTTTEMVRTTTQADARQQNILLFTDGNDSGFDAQSTQEILQKLMTGVQDDPRVKARNKFNVFNYSSGKQCALMQLVVNTFASEIVNLDTPDFMHALQNSEVMAQWAASRDLFSLRLSVEDSKGGRKDSQYAIAIDCSGQFASLKPIICQPGEVINMVVTDGNNNVVARSTTKVALATPPVQNPHYSILLSRLGLHVHRPSPEQTNLPDRISNTVMSFL